MDWSVALFGHYKPRYELREKQLTKARLPAGKNYQGIMLYQDILINKTVSRHVEPPANYDEDLYFIYNVTGWEQRAEPGDIIAFKPLSKAHTWTPVERTRFLIVTIKGPSFEQMKGLCEEQWDIDSYPVLPSDFWDIYKYDSIELRPNRHIKKRRFGFGFWELESVGVNINSMLDKEILYAPVININKTEAFDKLNERNVLESDGLNLLAPVRIMRPK